MAFLLFQLEIFNLKFSRSNFKDWAPVNFQPYNDILRNKVFKETSNVDISLADSGYYEKCSSEMETSEVLDTIDTSSDDAVIDSEVVEGTQLNKT